MTTSKEFRKHYIGSAKQIAAYGILKLTLPTETLETFMEDFAKVYDGREFLFLEVAPRKEKDKNGNTHNIYVNEMIVTQIPEPPKKTTKKAKA